ncbi:hypothetical protein C2845_PM04G16110 [Panicum miliaceum]|uniref:Uncharacterized protein n=1 Tax=Panicum miliaceum TaxID=4540 RepID=A0A3L6QNK6_PANMI|nr:hypothetical protein C2845_PM04G16110 [Panicum miliaceum]
MQGAGAAGIKRPNYLEWELEGAGAAGMFGLVIGSLPCVDDHATLCSPQLSLQLRCLTAQSGDGQAAAACPADEQLQLQHIDGKKFLKRGKCYFDYLLLE